MKRKLLYCGFILLLTHGCSLFNPQEPEAFGDVEVQLRFAEAPSMAGEADAQAFAKGNQHQRAQALDRFAISIFSYTPQLEEAGRELVRREIVVGEQRRLSVAVRVPLRSAPEDYFLAEVKAFQRGDLIYSGTDVFQFNDTTKTATVEILLYPVDFSVSFFLQSGLPRFVLGQAFVLTRALLLQLLILKATA